MRYGTKISAVALALGAALAIPAAAQNFNLAPTFGEANLNAGFGQYTVDLVAGGPIDAFTLGDDCTGSIADAPDFRVYYEGAEGYQLMVAVAAEVDTTLVINDPSGAWFCVDDYGDSLNPQVDFDLTSLSGQYDIWVGTYGGGTADATLTITDVNTSVAVDHGGPDFNLPPTFGEATLSAGFTQYTVDLVAGGPIDAATALDNCYGFIASAPDFRVYYEGAEGYQLLVSVIAETDTTLVINDPSGTWFCVDDYGDSLNPQVNFDFTSLSGQYDIWVGTYGGGTADATLTIADLTDAAGGNAGKGGGAAAPSLVCWYNEGGAYTGADGGGAVDRIMNLPGYQAGQSVLNAGKGDYAWAYLVAGGPDLCPATRP